MLEPRILAWIAREEIPFLMEVADRTEADRKGGHLARRREGGLVLRETAQTPDEDTDAFQDVERHRFFNTNTLWVDLDALHATLERDGVLGLPMIVNRKTVDPGDKESPAVIQLETAMGAAIDVFEGARRCASRGGASRPSRRRTTCSSLRSDAYVLTTPPASSRPGDATAPPLVDLDPDVFKLVADFDARFAAGPPSLVACERLTVEGDVAFGAGVVVRGTVTVRQEGDGQTRVEDGTVLEGWLGRHGVAVRVALGALLLGLALGERVDEQPDERDAHDDRLLERHEPRRPGPGPRTARGPRSAAARS